MRESGLSVESARGKKERISPGKRRCTLEYLRHISFLHLFLSFPPRAFCRQPNLPHPGKLPAVTHIPTFTIARKVMSRQCVVAWAVSTKKQLYTTLPLFNLYGNDT